MNPRATLCGVAALLGGLAVPAQDVVSYPPTAQTPAPPAAVQYEPGVRMRMPGPGGETPTPMARPDLGKWWKNSEIVKEIGLNEQQVNQIEQTFFDHRLKLIDLQADVQRGEARLQPLIESDQLDEAKISVQMDQLLAARSRLEKASMMMMISIRKVLSVEQWKKLEEIRDIRVRGDRTEIYKRSPDAPLKRKMPGPPEGPEEI